MTTARVVIIINKDKSMQLNQENIAEDKLADRLLEVFKTRAERVCFVKADPDLEFQFVAKAIDIAKGAQMDKVGLMTAKARKAANSRRCSADESQSAHFSLRGDAASGGISTGCKKLEARDNLNKGVQAFKGAKYADSVDFFKRAIELDPDLSDGPASTWPPPT